MSLAVDNIMECVTVELQLNSRTNIIIGCIYRTPGSNVDTFNESLQSIFGGKKQETTTRQCTGVVTMYW